MSIRKPAHTSSRLSCVLAAPNEGDPGLVADGAGRLALPRTNLRLSGHQEPDPGGGQDV